MRAGAFASGVLHAVLVLAAIAPNRPRPLDKPASGPPMAVEVVSFEEYDAILARSSAARAAAEAPAEQRLAMNLPAPPLAGPASPATGEAAQTPPPPPEPAQAAAPPPPPPTPTPPTPAPPTLAPPVRVSSAPPAQPALDEAALEDEQVERSALIPAAPSVSVTQPADLAAPDLDLAPPEIDLAMEAPPPPPAQAPRPTPTPTPPAASQAPQTTPQPRPRPETQTPTPTAPVVTAQAPPAPPEEADLPDAQHEGPLTTPMPRAKPQQTPAQLAEAQRRVDEMMRAAQQAEQLRLAEEERRRLAQEAEQARIAGELARLEGERAAAEGRRLEAERQARIRAELDESERRRAEAEARTRAQVEAAQRARDAAAMADLQRRQQEEARLAAERERLAEQERLRREREYAAQQQQLQSQIQADAARRQQDQARQQYEAQERQRMALEAQRQQQMRLDQMQRDQMARQQEQADLVRRMETAIGTPVAPPMAPLGDRGMSAIYGGAPAPAADPLAGMFAAADSLASGGGGAIRAPGYGGPSLELTSSERQQILGALRSCWHVDPAAIGFGSMSVTLSASLNTGGYVDRNSVRVVSPMPTPPEYQVAVESARRALLDTRCQPLPAPAHKYDAWRQIQVTFNPQNMGLQ